MLMNFDGNKSIDELIDSLINIGESLKGDSAGKDDRNLDAEGLLLKFICHCISINYLKSGIPSPVDKRIAILDPASINVLVRAALETYLTFQYVFLLPADQVERDLRFQVWRRSGVLERLISDPTTEEYKKLLPRIKEEAERLKSKIETNANFIKLPPKLGRKIIEKGTWKLPVKLPNGHWEQPSWIDIMILSGIERESALRIYGYLSCYAHSNHLSVSQIYEAREHAQRQIIIELPIDIIKVIIIMMINSYEKAFK
jgi:hypothetical protein